MKNKLQLLVLLLPMALFLLIFLSYHLAYWNRIYPGVTFLDAPLGNKTLKEATLLIDQKIQELDRNQKGQSWTLSYQGKSWSIDFKKAGLQYNGQETAGRAFIVGRNQSLPRNLQTQVRAWFKNQPIDPVYTLNRNQLESQIATVSAEVFIPTIDPTIKLIYKKIVIEPGRDGQELDKNQLWQMIATRLSLVNGGGFNTSELPIKKSSGQPTAEQTTSASQRAEKLIDKKIILATEDKQSWTLADQDLIGFISFDQDFDQEKIASWSASLAVNIDRPAENATFQFSDGRVVKFKPAKDGRTLDQQKTTSLITSGLLELKADSHESTISLPVSTSPASVQTGDVNNLGIRQLVGRGISNFKGSVASRVHNIQLASSRLNGVLIPPGETFSFLQALGEVSKETGYQEAYIIKEGRTILGDGGGVCQVSTTFFRTALDAGLPIIERQPHAYRVIYYEQESSPGLDATVFDPSPDLKVKNDTPAYLLIQTKIDLETKRLTFELYGTDDSRQVEISKPRIWDQTPPPPDLYQDDPTLPLGQVKQIEKRIWGAKASFDYKVERNGEVLQNRTFYSVYHPWQAVYLRGTKQ